MNELDILDSINEASGKNDKFNILSAAKQDKKLAQLLDAVFNYKRKFFIKKWDVGNAVFCNDDKHYEFIELLEYLESGQGRGDVAKIKVEEFFATLNAQQKYWYERVLKKDFKMGVSVNTAVKCGFDIPIFDVQLAKDGKKSKNLKTFVNKGGYASRKYDGYRCLAVIKDGDVTLYSRNGTVYENFPSVEQSLSEMFPVGYRVLDGEIMSDDFQAMQSTAFANKRGTTVGDVSYHVFDMIPWEEWESKEFCTKKSERLCMLKYGISLDQLLLNQDDAEELTYPDNIKLVEHTYVSDLNELLEMEKTYIEEGYEGVMFVPDIPYYLGKKTNKMIKLKTFKSQDVEIVGFNPGKSDGKYADTLGSFIVKQEDGQICNCNVRGDKFRDDIWKNKELFIGRIFEAAYQEETNDGIMRFPVFKRWRNDKE